MIIIDCDQGSPEWFQARAGVITASMFSEVRKVANGLTDQQAAYVAAIRSGASKADALKAAKYSAAPKSRKIEQALDGEKVGDFTEAAKDYAFRLAVERLTGECLADQSFETWAMRRGHELEPEARSLHSFMISKPVEHAGFIMTDDGKFGASADGLIEDDGGSEYKCYVAPEKLRPIIFAGDLSETADQVQGGMWISGRNWWHFVLYCPALAVVDKSCLIHPVDRDDDYIESMESDLLAFDALVCQYQDQLKSETPMEERRAA